MRPEQTHNQTNNQTHIQTNASHRISNSHKHRRAPPIPTGLTLGQATRAAAAAAAAASSAGDHEQGDLMRLGDEVVLQSESAGVLCVDGCGISWKGLVTPRGGHAPEASSASHGAATSSRDGRDAAPGGHGSSVRCGNPLKAVFRIEPLSQYASIKAFRKLAVSVKAAAASAQQNGDQSLLFDSHTDPLAAPCPIGLSILDAAHWEDLRREANTERRQNQEELARLIGKPVIYGMVVQLRNAHAGNYLCVNSKETCSDKSIASMRVGADTNIRKESLFRILPRYRIRAEGDYARIRDVVVLQSVKTESFLSVGQTLHSLTSALGSPIAATATNSGNAATLNSSSDRRTSVSVDRTRIFDDVQLPEFYEASAALQPHGWAIQLFNSHSSSFLSQPLAHSSPEVASWSKQHQKQKQQQPDRSVDALESNIDSIGTNNAAAASVAHSQPRSLPNKFAQVASESVPRIIRAGQYIRFYHKEKEGYLAAHLHERRIRLFYHQINPLYPKDTTSCITFWQIMHQNEHQGGELYTKQPIRLRHVMTNMYLEVDGITVQGRETSPMRTAVTRISTNRSLAAAHPAPGLNFSTNTATSDYLPEISPQIRRMQVRLTETCPFGFEPENDPTLFVLHLVNPGADSRLAFSSYFRIQHYRTGSWLHAALVQSAGRDRVGVASGGQVRPLGHVPTAETEPKLAGRDAMADRQTHYKLVARLDNRGDDYFSISHVDRTLSGACTFISSMSLPLEYYIILPRIPTSGSKSKFPSAARGEKKVKRIITALIYHCTQSAEIDPLKRKSRTVQLHQRYLRECGIVDLLICMLEIPFSLKTRAAIRRRLARNGISKSSQDVHPAEKEVTIDDLFEGREPQLTVIFRLIYVLLQVFLINADMDNQLYLARDFDTIAHHIKLRLGATDTLMQLVSSNRVIIESISTDQIDFFISLLAKEKRASFLEFLIALCHVSGSPVSKHQAYITTRLLQSGYTGGSVSSSNGIVGDATSLGIGSGHSNTTNFVGGTPLLFRLKLVKSDLANTGIMYEVAIQMMGDGNLSSSTTDHLTSVAGGVENVGRNVKKSGISAGSGINFGITNTSTDSGFNASAFGAASNHEATWIPLHAFCHPMSDAHKSGLFAFFHNGLALFEALCRGHNQYSIDVIVKRLRLVTTQIAIAILADKRVHDGVRAQFCHLLRVMFLDALPVTPVLHDYVFRVGRAAEVGDGGLSGDVDGVVGPLLASIPIDFVALDGWLTLFLEENAWQFAERRDRNELLVAALALLRTLTQYGFYNTHEQSKAKFQAVCQILNPRTDTHDHDRAKAVHMRHLGRSAEAWTRRDRLEASDDHASLLVQTKIECCRVIDLLFDIRVEARAQLVFAHWATGTGKASVTAAVRAASDSASSDATGADTRSASADVTNDQLALLGDTLRAVFASTDYTEHEHELTSVLFDLLRFKDASLRKVALQMLHRVHSNTEELLYFGRHALLLSRAEDGLVHDYVRRQLVLFGLSSAKMHGMYDRKSARRIMSALENLGALCVGHAYIDNDRIFRLHDDDAPPRMRQSDGLLYHQRHQQHDHRKRLAIIQRIFHNIGVHTFVFELIETLLPMAKAQQMGMTASVIQLGPAAAGNLFTSRSNSTSDLRAGSAPDTPPSEQIVDAKLTSSESQTHNHTAQQQATPANNFMPDESLGTLLGSALGFLGDYVAGDRELQHLVFAKFDILMSCASAVQCIVSDPSIGSAVFDAVTSIIASNVGLCLRISESQVRTALVNTRGVYPEWLSLLWSIIKVQGKILKRNQTLVMKCLQERPDLLALVASPVSTSRRPSRSQSDRFASPNGLAAGTNPSVFAPETLETRFQAAMLDLWAICGEGENRFCQSALQNLLNWTQTLVIMGSPLSPLPLKRAATRYFLSIHLFEDLVDRLLVKFVNAATVVNNTNAATTHGVGDGLLFGAQQREDVSNNLALPTAAGMMGALDASMGRLSSGLSSVSMYSASGLAASVNEPRKSQRLWDYLSSLCTFLAPISETGDFGSPEAKSYFVDAVLPFIVRLYSLVNASDLEREWLIDAAELSKQIVDLLASLAQAISGQYDTSSATNAGRDVDDVLGRRLANAINTIAVVAGVHGHKTSEEEILELVDAVGEVHKTHHVAPIGHATLDTLNSESQRLLSAAAVHADAIALKNAEFSLLCSHFEVANAQGTPVPSASVQSLIDHLVDASSEDTLTSLLETSSLTPESSTGTGAAGLDGLGVGASGGASGTGLGGNTTDGSSGPAAMNTDDRFDVRTLLILETLIGRVIREQSALARSDDPVAWDALDQRKTDLQNRLNRFGCTLMTERLMTSRRRALVHAAARLVIALLHGGNPTVQDTLRDFWLSTSEERFFFCVHEHILRFISRLSDTRQTVEYNLRRIERKAGRSMRNMVRTNIRRDSMPVGDAGGSSDTSRRTSVMGGSLKTGSGLAKNCHGKVASDVNATASGTTMHHRLKRQSIRENSDPEIKAFRLSVTINPDTHMDASAGTSTLGTPSAIGLGSNKRNLLETAGAFSSLLAETQSVEEDDHKFPQDLMRLLQLFAEGHNEVLQNYIRFQPDNVKSFDIVNDVVSYLHAVASVLGVVDMDTLLQLFDTLIELAQGCVQNQIAIFNTKVIPTINAIMAEEFAGVLPVTTARLRGKAVLCLLSLLEDEWNEDTRVIFREMNNTLQFGTILSHTDVSYRRCVVPAGARTDVYANHMMPLRAAMSEEACVLFDIAFLNTMLLVTLMPTMSDENRSLCKRSPGFLWFSSQTGRIEIVQSRSKGAKHLQLVLFPIPQIARELRQDIKEAFLWSVDRSSAEAKVQDFVARSKDMIVQMQTQYLASQNPWLLMVGNGHHWWWSGALTLTLILNLMGLMCLVEPNASQSFADVLRGRTSVCPVWVGYLRMILGLLHLCFWSLTTLEFASIKLPPLVNKLQSSRNDKDVKAASAAGTASAAARSAVSGGGDNSEISNNAIQSGSAMPTQTSGGTPPQSSYKRSTALSSSLASGRSRMMLARALDAHNGTNARTMFRTVVRGVINLMREARASIHRLHNAVWWIEEHLVYHCVMLALSLVSLWYPPLYCIHLLDYVYRDQVLQGVISSITSNWNSLSRTVLLGVVIVYIYGVISFVFFRSAFDATQGHYCHTLLECFVTILSFAVRAGGGVGEILRSPEESQQSFIGRVVLDLSFFLIVIIFILNVIFGIIFDTFKRLRDEATDIREDMKSTCFICSMHASEFQRLGRGFEDHVANDHNIWHYLFFFVHLQMKDVTEYTAQESYVAEMLAAGDYSFFPVRRARILLRRKRAGGDGFGGAGGGGHGTNGGTVDRDRVKKVEDLLRAAERQVDALAQQLRVTAAAANAAGAAAAGANAALATVGASMASGVGGSAQVPPRARRASLAASSVLARHIE